jgi:hypothetical protein
MAKIITRAGLNVGTELTVDESAKTFTLNVAGNLVAKDGVTLQALYSKFVELWATASYQDSPFPMYAIDALSGQFQFGTDGATFSGWKPATDATRQMLRDGGWSEYNSAGVLARQYAGIVGLGSVSAGAQLYYQRAAADAPANFTFVDQCNEGIQVLGNVAADATTTTFDKRAYFKGFVREQGKKYKDSVLADTGKTGTGANIVNLLLSNEDDLKIQAADAAMSGAPYSGITVAYFSANQSRSIGGTPRNFKIIINGNGATLEQIYTKAQYLLRQNADINVGGTAGVVTGKTAAALLAFVGDSLETAQSVYIDNVQAADSNRVTFKDDGGTNRVNPYTAAVTITFNAPLIGAGSSYRLMFTAPPGAGNDFGEAGAVTVNNAAGVPITGSISGASIAFDYDYDGNVQAGFTAGTDRAVTLVGIKPGGGKYVAATGMLTRSKAVSLSLVAEQDRVYA